MPAETQQARAARAIVAERRWAVTGTPLQNRLTDLFGLMVFLGVEPLHDRTFWRRVIERPMNIRDERGLKRLHVSSWGVCGNNGGGGGSTSYACSCMVGELIAVDKFHYVLCTS